MAYTDLGAGTEADPYLIVSEQDLYDFWRNNRYEWARLTRDLDMSDIGALDTGRRTSVYLDGAGHRVRNVSFADDPFWQEGSGVPTFRNIEFYILSGWTNHTYYYDGIDCSNVRWHYEHANNVRIIGVGRTNRCFFTNCIISGACNFIGASTQDDRTSGFYVVSGTTDAVRAATGRYTVLTTEQATLASSYSALDPSVWEIADGIIPYLKKTEYDYSEFSHIKGVTTVDGLPEPRLVRIYHGRYPGLIASGMSDEEGNFDLGTRPYTEPMLVLTHDDIGTPLKPATAYGLNAIVHPKAGNGYRYICIQAGTTEDPLPDVPWPTDQLTSGTAIFEARKIRQPIVEGPLTPAPVIPPSEQEQ